MINEILFDPAGSDTGLEWIELYNSGDAPENLSGWSLYPDGIGYFLFPTGFTLGAKQFVTVRLRASDADSPHELYYAAASANMGNSAGSVALFSAGPRNESTIRSFAQWGRSGETWESAALLTGLWQEDSAVATTSPEEGASIGLVSDGISNGAGKAWISLYPPTPGAPNHVSASTPVIESAALSPSLPVPSGQQAYSSSWPQTMRVYAGEDAVSAVGSEMVFSGLALGLKDEPLEHARFFWNFGDGETEDGRVISHIFRIPGSYTAGLHVSSGMYASSDYRMVTVVPNQVVISGVTTGSGGSIRLHNRGDTMADIGGWMLRDADGTVFEMPASTKIGARSEIGLANIFTGLGALAHPLPMRLLYSNGTDISVWDGVIREEARPSLLSHAPVGKAPVSVSGEREASLLRTHADLKPAGERVGVDIHAQAASGMALSASSGTPYDQASSSFGASMNAFWIASGMSIAAAAGFFFMRKFFI